MKLATAPVSVLRVKRRDLRRAAFGDLGKPPLSARSGLLAIAAELPLQPDKQLRPSEARFPARQALGGDQEATYVQRKARQGSKTLIRRRRAVVPCHPGNVLRTFANVLSFLFGRSSLL